MIKYDEVSLKTKLASYVDASKLANTTFSVTRNNIVGLVDKIAKIVMFDTAFIDKLDFMDAEYLQFGKTIEEWQEDLQLPATFDATGQTTLAPQGQSYRPAHYSFTLDEVTFGITIPNNDIEKAVNNASELVSIVAMKYKRLYDSETAWRYGVKKELIGKAIDLAIKAQGSDATSYVAGTTALTAGAFYKYSTEYGVAIVSATASSANTWAALKAAGKIILIDLVTTIAKPVDDTTGEAFIKQLKQDVEIAGDMSEGHSFNGNTLGVSDLVLITKQGIMPSIEVDTQAGAFHTDKVGIPTEVRVVNSFGSADSTYSSVYAVLMDKRALRLYPNYRATRDQMNAQGDFLNIFLHNQSTGALSRNVFFKVYKAS